MQASPSFCDSLANSCVSDRLFACPLECPDLYYANADLLLQHLKSQHCISVAKPKEVILFLQRYIDVCYAENAKAFHASCPESPLILGADDDHSLRRRLQGEKLASLLAAQQIERQTLHRQRRKCLFCPEESPNLSDLFRHMFQVHSFNIGLLDNLVEVGDFLTALSATLARNQCIYCLKIFPTSSMLKKHMKSKGHFKIHPRNHAYDRHYIVNFTEPGTSWDSLDLSGPGEEQGSIQDDVGDYEGNSSNQDDDFFQRKASCLFGECEQIAQPKEIWEHMAKEHGFDFPSIVAEFSLGFYEGVKIVNWIRESANEFQCFICCCKEESRKDDKEGDEVCLKEHFKEKHSQIEGTKIMQLRAVWDDERFLVPQCDDDSLLMALDEICNPSDV